MREEQFLNVSSQSNMRRTDTGTLTKMGASTSGWTAATASATSMEIATAGDVPFPFTNDMRLPESTCKPQSRTSLPAAGDSSGR